MTETEAPESDWIRAWIEQQREELRRAAEGASASTQDLASRWFEAAHAYLRGMSEFAQAARPDAESASAASSSTPGDEVPNIWRDAWAGANAASREATQRFLDALGRMPPLGIAREQTESWRELAAAQREHQQLEQALRLEFARVQQEALSLLEQRIRERELANRPIGAWRELYDLWVECGEQAFAKIAHSEPYARLQAELGNAAIRLRARQQTILEYMLRQFDLPTRSELNSVHRQLRELKARLQVLEERPGASSSRESGS